jgi:hypothetical protein
VTDDSRLTKCETAGNVVSFSNPTAKERDAIMLVYIALRGAKHAVICDEVHHGDNSSELRILHYRTCLACVGAR